MEEFITFTITYFGTLMMSVGSYSRTQVPGTRGASFERWDYGDSG